MASNEARAKWRKYRFFIPFFFFALILALGWVVMVLWNWILPETIGVQALTYPKALGLLVLCRILFGGFKGGSGPRFRSRGGGRGEWMHLSDEERAKMRAEWEARCRNTDNP
jgi:hypothetical protein